MPQQRISQKVVLLKGNGELTRTLKTFYYYLTGLCTFQASGHHQNVSSWFSYGRFDYKLLREILNKV